MKRSIQNKIDKILSTIKCVISDKALTMNWKENDTKTTWLARARFLGLEGWSSLLYKEFINHRHLSDQV